MSKILIVKSCKTCPCRVDKESHGPCDSSYWCECSINGNTVEDQDSPATWKGKFPPFCPLKDVE